MSPKDQEKSKNQEKMGVKYEWEDFVVHIRMSNQSFALILS